MGSARSHLLAAAVMVMLVCVAGAVTKIPPDLSGFWKLNRAKSTAEPRFMKDDTLVIQQDGDKLEFHYSSGGAPTGTQTVTADDTERPLYTTRIERAYDRTRWRDGNLVITTRHVLDILGYQAYSETERWVLSADRKTLTYYLSDGKIMVYDWEGPPPNNNTLDDVKDFHAVAVRTGSGPTTNSRCQFNWQGTLKGNTIETGNYEMCMAPASGSGIEDSAACGPMSGTLHFKRQDGVTGFMMNITGQFCPANQTLHGTYDIEPHSITGAFVRHLKGGSGMVEMSRNSNTILLNGLLVYH